MLGNLQQKRSQEDCRLEVARETTHKKRITKPWWANKRRSIRRLLVPTFGKVIHYLNERFLSIVLSTVREHN
jgi:hypothetical protein